VNEIVVCVVSESSPTDNSVKQKLSLDNTVTQSDSDESDEKDEATSDTDVDSDESPSFDTVCSPFYVNELFCL